METVSVLIDPLILAGALCALLFVYFEKTRIPRLLPVVICLLIVAGCGYGERQRPVGPVSSSSGGEHGAIEVGATAVLYAIKKKNDYQQALTTGLHEMDKRITAMEGRLASLNPPEARQYGQVVWKARNEARSAHNNFGSFKTASLSRCDQIKAEIEANMKNVEKLYRQVFVMDGPSPPVGSEG